MTVMIDAPTSEEISRVKAWEAELVRQAEQREKDRLSRMCLIHGYGPSRVLYGPMPWGYGSGCGKCRREWSRRHGGRRWYSAAAQRERDQVARAAITARVQAMPPAEFYAAWNARLAERLEAQGPRWRWYEMKQDEFGMTMMGCATPEGYEYTDMRARVRTEARAFEEARDVI